MIYNESEPKFESITEPLNLDDDINYGSKYQNLTDIKNNYAKYLATVTLFI